MKAYLITSGSIFGLFASFHLFITYEHWQAGGTAGDVLGPAAICVAGAALAVWAVRLARHVVAQ